MTIVYAQQNDSLDAVIYRYFGRSRGLLESTLELNPHLASKPILEIGDAVVLPEVNEVLQDTTINLWN